MQLQNAHTSVKTTSNKKFVANDRNNKRLPNKTKQSTTQLTVPMADNNKDNEIVSFTRHPPSDVPGLLDD